MQTSNHIGLPQIEVYRDFAVTSPDNQKLLTEFLDVVFRQVDTKKFLEIYNATVWKYDSSEQVYQSLLEGSSRLRKNVFTKLHLGLKALNKERGTLAENLAKIMDLNATRNGYVEIGMPGRMVNSMKALTNLEGRIVVINEEESVIQSGTPKPYHEFQVLTYDPLNIPSESVDMISCFAGLHHCPEEKLESFIKSIHQTLREGGIFLLREHDTDTSQMTNLAWVVHSVFNCNTDVTIESEKAEVRNFKSIQSWTELLENSGFKLVSDPLIREGDSSKNALLKFVKVTDRSSDIGQLNVLRERLRSEQKNYTRGSERTILNRCEWLNVDASKSLGEDRNFWDHDYFGEYRSGVKTYWSSLAASTRSEGFLKTISSEAFSTNTVLHFANGAEYVAKGFAYLPFKIVAKIGSKTLPQRQEDPEWDSVSAQYQEWMQNYGEELDETPFYAQNYMDKVPNYWKNLRQRWHASRASGRSAADLVFDRQTLNNVMTGIVVTADMTARASIASIVNSAQGGVENGDERTIGLIVKGNFTRQEDDGIEKIISENDFGYQAIVAHRYKNLKKCIKALTNQNLSIVEIAGQREVQIDLCVDPGCQVEGGEKLYTTRIPGNNKIYFEMKVPVEKLGDFISRPDFHRLYDF